ncbi:PH domain-containing protein [Haloplanus halophilus]|uniref:PH domain-containing protein n=1 Tax=Haloplanus halophilus TaxID=2949993 RepID=UPI0020402366|nr:PH domain-containing protein [Haloplanus sp. GDY1]
MVPTSDWLSLDTDETVVWRGAPRVRRVLPTVVAAALWIVVLAVGAAVALRTRMFPTPIPVAGAALLALPAVGAAAASYLRTVNVEYVLTDRNCYRKRGVLSTRVTRIGLANVQRTALDKSVWGTLFDYGTVSISTAGSDGVDLRLTDLDDPEAARDELRRLAGADGSERRERRPAGLDAATADALLAEVGALRSAADRLDREVSDG